jgi:hypothetical protein
LIARFARFYLTRSQLSWGVSPPETLPMVVDARTLIGAERAVVLTDTSIPRLYLAGFIPGIALASLFSLTVLAICLIRPELGGKPTATFFSHLKQALLYGSCIDFRIDNKEFPSL